MILPPFLARLASRLNRRRFGTRADGPWRFLVRDWRGIDDITLLAAALAAETWRARLRPRELSLEGIPSLLLLAPHQDDELIGAGGLLLEARDRGLRTTVLFVTDGAQTGIEVDGRILEPAEVAARREAEAREVCRGLGARYACLGIDNVTMAVGEEHLRALRRYLAEERPTVVLVPWLFDGSPKHRVAVQLLHHALEGMEPAPREVWGYQVNNTPFANGWLDVTRRMEEKLRLLEIYASQNRGLRSYVHLARGLGAWNARFLPSKRAEESERYVEIFCCLPTAAFRSLVEEHYLRDPLRTYLGKDELARRMARLARAGGRIRATEELSEASPRRSSTP